MLFKLLAVTAVTGAGRVRLPDRHLADLDDVAVQFLREGFENVAGNVFRRGIQGLERFHFVQKLVIQCINNIRILSAVIISTNVGTLKVSDGTTPS